MADRRGIEPAGVLKFLTANSRKKFTLREIMDGMKIDRQPSDNIAATIWAVTKLLDEGKINEDWAGKSPCRERVYWTNRKVLT